MPAQASAASGDGSLVSAEAASDVDGEASAEWKLGTTAGEQEVVASVEGVGDVHFEANAAAGPVSAIVFVSGEAQTGVVAQVLAADLVARAVDAFGNGVPGVTLQWEASADGGLSSASSTTGTQTAKVFTGSIEASFAATALADVRDVVVVVSGHGQSELLGTVLPDPLVCRVEDQYGNPVPNVTVDWVVILGPGSVSPASAQTDANGEASTTWTLGAVLGLQKVEARVSGSVKAEFTATAL